MPTLTPTPESMTRQQVREYLAHRNRAVVDAAQWFTWGHLPEGFPRDLSAGVANLADFAINVLPDTPELTHGLRRLLEAKDCFVRAAIAAAEDASSAGKPDSISGDKITARD